MANRSLSFLLIPELAHFVREILRRGYPIRKHWRTRIQIEKDCSLADRDQLEKFYDQSLIEIRKAKSNLFAKWRLMNQ